MSGRNEDLAGLPENFDFDSGHCNDGVVGGVKPLFDWKCEEEVEVGEAEVS